MSFRVEVHQKLGEIAPEAWDALTGDDDPFVEHGYLSAIEESKSVGGRSGWHPFHVTVWEGSELVGALPLYAKEHSYGEYIFDFAWAGAAQRSRIPYYPKLTSMAPFTPATGKRILARDRDRERVLPLLLAGVDAVAKQVGCSSAHLLFVNEEEKDLVAQQRGWMPRLSYQFHWHGHGEKTYAEYLGRMRHESRKQTKRERRRVAESGLDVRVRLGSEVGDREWAALAAFYQDTCDRKGSEAYLRPKFFDLLRKKHGHRVVTALAYDGADIVAGTLNLEKGKHLYGRWWGASSAHDSLHFELCYHVLIERAIARGCTRFEAGAQGYHKLKRGLVPSATWSMHRLYDERLEQAVEQFLPREASAVRREMAQLSEHSPFKHEGSEDSA